MRTQVQIPSTHFSVTYRVNIAQSNHTTNKIIKKKNLVISRSYRSVLDHIYSYPGVPVAQNVEGWTFLAQMLTLRQGVGVRWQRNTH